MRVEWWYASYPWVAAVAVLYLLTLLFYRHRALLVLAFAAHTCVLALRCYLLGRPPVANMGETLLFVPWVAVIVGGVLFIWQRRDALLVAAAGSAAALLIALVISGGARDLDTVAAVLDSRYWLTIHVLMVVGSYGVFIVSGVLGHLALVWRGHPMLTRAVLASLYSGTALLIAGTILGGVWAAQSWGRFWDWDPKESWAFITSSIYLLVIHAYRFGFIGRDGLAIGSIIGLLSVSFTWYGVNYILGTGFHSYGFGHGGELYYWSYVAIEGLFLVWACNQSLTKRTG